jgi:hypothetical protein
MIALISCILPLLSFTLGKKVHRAVNSKIVQMLLFSTLYLILDVLPSTVLYTDMQCRGATMGGMGTAPLCAFQRCAIHLLQVVYYLMATSLLELEMKILKIKNGEKITKVMHALSFIIPLVCCIATAAIFPSVASQYPNNYYELWGWNFLKDPFRCTLQLETSAMEWVWVHVHFVGLSLAVIFMCSSVIRRALKSALKQPGSGSEQGKKGSFHQRVRDSLAKSKTGKLVALASQVSVLVILQLVIQISLASVLSDFSENLAKWQTCSYTASVNGGIQICDEFKNASAPPALGILILYYLSGPLISMVVGITFGYDKKHLLAFKVILGFAKPGSSIGGSTVAPMSSASS